MKKHPLESALTQWAYRQQYDTLLGQLNIKQGCRILDIGSGLGFLKPLVENKGGNYLGIEPDSISFDRAQKLYGSDCFIKGFFPQCLDGQKFDVIIALSCAEEVPDKRFFLDAVRAQLEPQGIAYLAVRNGNFFTNKFKSFARLKSQESKIRDISVYEWENLIKDSGLRILVTGKFWRPWLTEISFTGAKNIIYRLFSMILPHTQSYMIYYKVSA